MKTQTATLFVKGFVNLWYCVFKEYYLATHG